MLGLLFSILAGYWFHVLLLSIAVILIRNFFHHGLQKYPGPLLANFTDLWRFVDVAKRRPDTTQLKLHRRHGNVVRLGPNFLSFSDPQAVKTIYGLNKGFKKSSFYPVQQATSHGKRLQSLFSTTDEAYHAQLRRCVNNAFSMSSLVQYEPSVNEVIEIFLDKTQQLYAETYEACNFSRWLQFFAFDVIGQITYSKRHGFIEKNEDIDGMVDYLGRLFSYVGPVGQWPWIDLLFLKNPLVLLLDRWGVKVVEFPITKFAKARMAERLTRLKSDHTTDEKHLQPEGPGQRRKREHEKDAEAGLHIVDKEQEKMNRPGLESAQTAFPRADLLSMFFAAQSQRPDFMTDERVLTMAISMTFAGSDTTAISLSAVFYYLLQNPSCLSKLQSELTDARTQGVITPRSSGLVTWSEAQNLPYLDACIKEALRLHPAAGLPLERIVPEGGIDIAGHFVPGGTIVGVSAWVLHHGEDIFGERPDDYLPERWLGESQGGTTSKERRKEMESHMFQFGAGPRTCIGKNISLLEMYKLVPSFLSRFEIELANPGQSWRLHNAWFVKQHDFNTRFRLRKLDV